MEADYAESLKALILAEGQDTLKTLLSAIGLNAVSQYEIECKR